MFPVFSSLNLTLQTTNIQCMNYNLRSIFYYWLSLEVLKKMFASHQNLQNGSYNFLTLHVIALIGLIQIHKFSRILKKIN